MNRYTYCANNPIRYYDPTGHRLKGDEELLNDQGLAMVDYYASEWKKYEKLAKDVKNKNKGLYNEYKGIMTQMKSLASDVRTSQVFNKGNSIPINNKNNQNPVNTGTTSQQSQSYLKNIGFTIDTSKPSVSNGIYAVEKSSALIITQWFSGIAINGDISDKKTYKSKHI